MNLKDGIKTAVSTVTAFTKKNSPEITTAAGIGLMLAGAVGCIVATVKTMHAVADAKEEKLLAIAPDTEAYENLTAEEQQEYDDICENPMPVKEVIPLVWKHWVGPFFAEAGGVFCLIFSNRESAKRLAIVSSTLATQIAEANDYKEAAKELFGEEKEQEIDEKAAKKKGNRVNSRLKPIDLHEGDDVFFDYYGGRPFYATIDYLTKKCNEFNQDLVIEGKYHDCGLSLNDWYYKIGLEPTGEGGSLFWNIVGETKERTELAKLDFIWDDDKQWFIVKFKKGYAPVYPATIV